MHVKSMAEAWVPGHGTTFLFVKLNCLRVLLESAPVDSSPCSVWDGLPEMTGKKLPVRAEDKQELTPGRALRRWDHVV